MSDAPRQSDLIWLLGNAGARRDSRTCGLALGEGECLPSVLGVRGQLGRSAWWRDRICRDKARSTSECKRCGRSVVAALPGLQATC